MEEDDDLEALRLAALQTIKPRKVERINTAFQSRYYRQKANPNLIEIVTKDEIFTPNTTSSACGGDMTESKVIKEKKIEKSVIEQHEEKQQQHSQQQEEKKIRSKFRTDNENADGKILKLDEDQLDFEYESDHQLGDEDSLEKLMDEMELEFNEKPPTVSTLRDKNVIKAIDKKVKKMLSRSRSPIEKQPQSKKPKNVSNKNKCPSSSLEKLTRKSISPQHRFRKSVSPIMKRLATPQRKPTGRYRSPESKRSSSPTVRRSPTPNLRASLRQRRSSSSKPRRSYSPKPRRLSPNIKSRLLPVLGRRKRSRSLTPKSRQSESPRRTINNPGKKKHLTPVKTKILFPLHLRSSQKSLDSHRTPSLSPPKRNTRSPIHRHSSQSPISHKMRRSTSPRRRLVRNRSPIIRKRSESPINRNSHSTHSELSRLKHSKRRKSPQPQTVEDQSKAENGCTDANITFDSKLEARKKKFQSTTIVAPIKKKIRLKFSNEGKTENEATQIKLLDEPPVLIKCLKKSRVPLEEDRINFEAEPTVDKSHTTKMDLKKTDNHPITLIKEIVISKNSFDEIPPKKNVKDFGLSKHKKLEKVKAKGKQLGIPKIEINKLRKTKLEKKNSDFYTDSKDSLLVDLTFDSEKTTLTKLVTKSEDVDNGNDLREELSRRRAERLRETNFQPAARIIQSAFEGVVNSKRRTRKQLLPENESSKKMITLKGRRVHVVCLDRSKSSGDGVSNEELYEQTSSLSANQLTTLGTSALVKQNKAEEEKMEGVRNNYDSLL